MSGNVLLKGRGAETHRNNNVRCEMMINIINNKPLAKFCLAVMWYRRPQREGNRSQEKNPLPRHSQGGGECLDEAVWIDSNAWRSDRLRQSSDQGEGGPLLVRKRKHLAKNPVWFLWFCFGGSSLQFCLFVTVRLLCEGYFWPIIDF